MKRICVAVLMVIYVVGTIGFAFAGGGGMSGGALESTQQLNKAELIKQVEQAIKTVNNQITQITNQITMIQDMVHNTLSFPNQLFAPIANIYSQVQDVMNNSMGVVYTLQNFDQELKNTFKSYGDLQTHFQGRGARAFGAELNDITFSQRETIRSTIEALGLSGKEIETDADFLRQLQQAASSADGRNQILDVANQFAAFQADQAMKIRQALINFTVMVSTTMEAEQAQSDVEKVMEERMMQNIDHGARNVPVNEFGW